MNGREMGALLAALRKERGLTQRQVAERLTVSLQAVSKWERGETHWGIAATKSTIHPLASDAYVVGRFDGGPNGIVVFEDSGMFGQTLYQGDYVIYTRYTKLITTTGKKTNLGSMSQGLFFVMKPLFVGKLQCSIKAVRVGRISLSSSHEEMVRSLCQIG